MNRAAQFSAAWTYFHASRAGLTRREASVLPVGKVYDQIYCWLIEERGMKQKAKTRDVFDI